LFKYIVSFRFFKDYFKGFQDRFYDYMKERYPNKAVSFSLLL